ncbi:putative ribonuclease H-like domain-containing protein [Tanacetum coccineum]|uniref:Ribonuclease H-like domain-containing protein n=1 Tax=Tanacetum coccineum TaxID=301880 RepID=A0ABQ4ZEZ9_9ASTR
MAACPIYHQVGGLSHRQEAGIDYLIQVFAPVARIEAIRLFLAFALYGIYVYQWMSRSAFCYGEIEEEVYVTQPKGFEDPHFPKHVYRVVKALYGLHQALRAWGILEMSAMDMPIEIDMGECETGNQPFEASKAKNLQDEPDANVNGSFIGLNDRFLRQEVLYAKSKPLWLLLPLKQNMLLLLTVVVREFLLVALNVPTGRTIPAGFVGFLEKPKGSADYHQVLDFLRSSHISTKSGSWDQFGSSLATALICLTEGRKFNWLINHLRPNHPILASAQENEQGPFSDPNPASSSRPHPSEPKQFTSTNVEDDVFGGSFDISPPRSTEASPAGKIDSQASDLQAHKLVFKEVVGKLVKKVKELEDKLKGRKRKFVMTESDLKEEEEQDVDPLIKLAKAAATAADDSAVPTGGSNEDDIPPSSSIPFDGSAIPPDVTTGPTDAPCDKGKSPMLGVEATRRLYEEEQAELAREREEQKKKRQKDVLKSVKYYTDADWNEIIERMVAMIAERRRKFAAQRFQDKRNKPMTYAQQRDYMRTFVKNQSSTIYTTGWTMKHVRSFSDDQLKDEFDKIRHHQSPFCLYSTFYYLHTHLKRLSSHPDVTADTSKQPSIAPTLPSGFSATPTVTRTSGPRTRNQSSAAGIKTYSTRRKSLGSRKMSSSEVDLNAADKSFIKVLSDDDSDDSDSSKYFTHLREILHLLNRQDLSKLYGMVVKHYEANPIAGAGMMLWGDLHVLFESVEGDTPYPILASTMKKMLKHKLEVEINGIGNDMTHAEQLIAFIKNRLVACLPSA